MLAKSLVVEGPALIFRPANMPHRIVYGHEHIAQVQHPGWGARHGRREAVHLRCIDTSL